MILDQQYTGFGQSSAAEAGAEFRVTQAQRLSSVYTMIVVAAELPRAELG